MAARREEVASGGDRARDGLRPGRRRAPPNASLYRISPMTACRNEGTKTFARSPDWRTEADRILAAVKERKKAG